MADAPNMRNITPINFFTSGIPAKSPVKQQFLEVTEDKCSVSVFRKHYTLSAIASSSLR